MAENLYNGEHKAVSDKYRQNYDKIEWDDEIVDLVRQNVLLMDKSELADTLTNGAREYIDKDLLRILDSAVKERQNHAA